MSDISVKDLSLVMRMDSSRLWAVTSSRSSGTRSDIVEMHLEGRNAPELLESLKRVIYDSPTLLADYGSVVMIFANSPQMPVPPMSVEEAERMFRRTFVDEADTEVELCPTGTDNALMVLGVDSPTSKFLQRTFTDIRFTSHLSVLTSYFAGGVSAGNGARIYAVLSGKNMDIIAVDRRKLLLAVTRPVHYPMDGVYFIMASLQSLGMDPLESEVYVGGEIESRNEVMSLLRDYVAHVMPVILPGAPAGTYVPMDLAVYPKVESVLTSRI